MLLKYSCVFTGIGTTNTRTTYDIILCRLRKHSRVRKKKYSITHIQSEKGLDEETVYVMEQNLE